MHHDRRRAAATPVRWLRLALIASLGLSACIEAKPAGPIDEEIVVADVAVSAPATTVEVGATLQASARALDGDGVELTGRTFTWASNATAGATVDAATGLVTGVAPGSVRISATDAESGETGSITIVVVEAAVDSVAVSPPARELQAGDTAHFTVVLRDARDAILSGRAVEWTSSDEAVAMVDASGVVTAMAAGGPVTITATAGGVSGTAQVTVLEAPVANVVVSPDTTTLIRDEAVQFTATLTDADGDTLSGRAVVWSSSDGGIAQVSATGVVTGVAAGGPVSISAQAEGVTGSASVTVAEKAIAALSIEPDSAAITVGDSAAFIAHALAADGDTLTDMVISWASADTAVVTVDASGMVRAVAVGGPVQITASASGFTATAHVTVSAIPVTTVIVAPDSATLEIGGTVLLSTTVLDANGDTLTGRPITWTSSDTTIATVDAGGTVTAVAAGGPVTITATVEGISDSAVISVNAPVVTVASVDVSPDSATLEIGGTVLLSATVLDANGDTLTGRPIAWTSGDTTIATVDAGGTVTAVAAGGPVTITATVEGISDSAVISVNAPVVTVASVDVSPDSTTLEIGDSTVFSAVVLDSNGDTMAVAPAWASLDGTIATVDAGGLVVAVDSGMVGIIASVDGLADTAYVTVTAPVPSGCTWVDDHVVGAIGLADSIAGALDAADCVNGTQYSEVWTLDVSADTVIRINLTSAEFDTYLKVYDDTLGVVLENDDWTGTNSAVVGTLTPGRYYVEATSFDSAAVGAYTLETTLIACTTISDYVVGATAVNDTVVDALTTTDCLDAGEWYTDGWTLQLDSERTLVFDVASAEFDAYVAVLDDTFGIVGADDNGSGGTDAHLELTLAAGSYYVMVSSAAGFETGAYELRVEDPATCTTVAEFLVGTAPVGATQNGSLDAADCVFDDGTYGEAWQLDLVDTTAVTIDMSSAEFDAYLLLANSAGEWITENDDAPAGGTSNAQITARLAPGTYYITANSYDPGAVGAYSITVSDAVAAGTCTLLSEYLAGSLAYPDTVAGTLSPGDCLDSGNWYTELWQVDVATATDLTMTMSSADVDAYLILFDGTLAVVDESNGGAGGTNAALGASVAAGTYYVAATTVNSFETGAYTLSVVESAAVPCSLVGVATVGAVYAGELSAADCQLSDGSYAEVWRVDLAAPTTLTFRISSTEFDPYAILTDLETVSIAQNNDDPAGGTTDAVVTQSLAAGSYYIFANTWVPGATGSYELTITN